MPSYDRRRSIVNGPTNFGVDCSYGFPQPDAMLDTDELLARLKAKGVRNIEIARVLNLPDSRVPEIRDRRRALKLDEGAKLARAFGLESDQVAAALPASVVRLALRHIARKLDAPLNDETLEDLAADLRAFSAFVSDPKVRRSVEAADAFFQALALRHPEPEEAARQETDLPQPR